MVEEKNYNCMHASKYCIGEMLVQILKMKTLAESETILMHNRQQSL